MYPIDLFIEENLFSKYARFILFRNIFTWNSKGNIYFKFCLCLVLITYFGLESIPAKAYSNSAGQPISNKIIAVTDSDKYRTAANFDCTQVTNIPQSECLGLVSIYEETGGENWSKPWLIDTNPCTWPGITCEEGHIINLELQQFGLSGVLPDQISNFTNLAKLELRINRLDSISPQIGQLRNLYWLGLQNNNLTSLPPEIGDLEKLTTLQLGGNQLSELPPQIGQLETLERFDLRKNKLIRIPAEFGRLIHLEGLNLSDNQLVTLPAEFSDLQAASSLDLSNNPWQEFPIAVTGLGNLGWLYINNSLLTVVPDQIANMTNLKVLEIRNNDLVSVSPALGKLTNLTGFDFSSNLLSTLPAEIQDLPNLIWLDLKFNRFTEPIKLSRISGLDWIADQIIPPSGFQVDNRVEYSAIESPIYSTHLLWEPLPSVIHDGFYEIRYAKLLDDLEANYQLIQTESRASTERQLSLDNVRPGETYFFQIFTYVNKNQQDELEPERKERWSEPSEIISATIPFIEPLQVIKERTSPERSQDTQVLIRAKNLPASLFASLFVNDVFFNERPQVGAENELFLSLDVSDLPQIPATYLTEIVLREPESNNRTKFSIKFSLPSTSLDETTLDGAGGVPTTIKVHRYVITLMYLPLVMK